MRGVHRLSSLGALVLLLLGVVPLAAPASAASTSCTPQTNPFSVLTANWGAAGAPQSVYPGNQNVPLTVTLLFSGPCSSPQATFTLSLTSGLTQLPFTQTSGNSPSTISLNISPNTIVAETFYLNVFQNAPTGVTYSIPLTIQYANNDPSNALTETLNVPIALQGPVTLNYASNNSRLTAGIENNVTITVSNSGTAASGAITTTVTVPSTVTLLNQVKTISSLGAGANTTLLLQLFVPTSLSGTAITLTFAGKYLDAYLNGQTTTQSLGFLVTTPTVEAGSSWVVQGAAWGSAGSATSPLPGTQNQPLVVSLQYLGATAVTSLQGIIQLPQGVTDLNGRSTAVAYSSANINQYGAVQLTFNLNLASTVKPGSYDYTLALTWMTSQSLGLTQTAVLSPPPVAQLQSSFQVESATWGTTATASAPVPGTQDEPLVVTLQYLGTTSVTNVQGVLGLPGGITDLGGRSSATAYAASANANQVITLTYYLNVASTVKPGSYDYTLNLSWATSVGVALSQTAAVLPAPIGAPSATAFPLSLSQTNSTVKVGVTTTSAFQLANAGTSSIYSPTFSLTVIAPLVLVSVASTTPATQLDPGKSTTFTAKITSGPTATPGIYSGTLTVGFTDQYGVAHTQQFPVAFTLQGAVVLVLQNTQVTQSLTGFTITGSILNEGTVAAYYSSLTGAIQGSTAAPVYLGEIDPNSPLPFSITIPFAAPTSISTNTTSETATGNKTAPTITIPGQGQNITRTLTGIGNLTRTGNFTGRFPGIFSGSGGGTSTATIALALQYKDTFGNSQTSPFTVQATVKPASQLAGGTASPAQNATTSDVNLLQYVAYVVVAAVVASVIVGAVYIRRQRAKARASLSPELKEEKAVI